MHRNPKRFSLCVWGSWQWASPLAGICQGGYRLPSFGIHPPWGMFSSMATSRAALSAPVCPPDCVFRSIPDMILVNIIGENTGCLGEIQEV